MSMTLALVTCGPQLEVCLQGPAMRAPSVIRLGGASPRSTLLLAAIDLLVEDAQVDRQELSRLVVARGPGSFTGIRSGLATAAGLAAATGARILACDSLLAQAMRVGRETIVWAAQPGRRGQVYARPYQVKPGALPEPTGDLEILVVKEIGERGPWVAAPGLNLGSAPRADCKWTAAEALIEAADLGLPETPVEPLYVEGPPIHGSQANSG